MSFFQNLLAKLIGGLGPVANQLVDHLTQNGLWDKIKEGSKTLGRETTRIALELYFVMRSDNTPKTDKAIIAVALGYQFTPGLLKKEDVGPIMAMVDNAITLAFAYNRVKKNVTPEITTQVNAQLEQWFAPKTAEANAPAEAEPVVATLPEGNQSIEA